NGGAQLALMNPGGVRADIEVPPEGGNVNFAQLFKAQPFGNNLIVRRLTGRQLRAVLEQQFRSGSNTTARPRVLFPSQGFSYAYDLRQPPGKRIRDMKLNGKPVQDDVHYRVTMNSYLANGGDNFSVFKRAERVAGGMPDIDALEGYLQIHSPVSPPATDRIRRLDR
ncbi:MAG TPA: 5'-nucleotidase, partial [Oxalicibacterium sp.]|nr:5'-nucleotidase [Oxalicibacterium sp.]